MSSVVLQANPSKDDTAWRFTVSREALASRTRPNAIYGKFIKFTAAGITLQIEKFPSNRILHADDPSKFILLSFGDLRFPETNLRATSDYVARLMKAGLFLNNVQYRFYHHSNSQLRGRSCFMREANNDAELDERIYQYGDYGKIMNAAKRAKRIGLLFSEAQVDYQLDPRYVTDIADIKSGDELFSDGCGLISKRLAIQLSKAKRIIFRGTRYTPTVYQIRYLGYKGVLMLHPQLDRENSHLVQFRKSMKKFATTQNHTFSVVDYSKPYSFGRLNNDIIVLLSTLGITHERLLAKQEGYFQWITGATADPLIALDFLSCLDGYALAERVLLEGLEDPEIQKQIRKFQLKEVGSFRNARDKNRSRMIIQKSRLLFGVCDPFGVLKEGEVHIRVTASRKGPTTPIHGDVLVVRNPCLHPGDCLKLRAVNNNALSHLIDCIVFASVARPGHHAAPSMSSGGDLDGDKYFVCWDPDLVPARVAESYDYPPNKELVSKKITREDLANYFAAYNNSGVARVAALHAKWVRASPQGALSPECQELNALHSQSVDGARIRIPDRLATPPEPEGPYILDLLADAASQFATTFAQSASAHALIASTDPDEAKRLITRLLQSNQNALSEYELFNLAYNLARKHQLDTSEIRVFLSHIDTAALSVQEKYALINTLNLDVKEHPYVWNSLIRSDILTPRDLYQRSLNQPFSIQRLYSSKISGLRTFFEYLKIATQDFTRKLLVLKVDDRFAVGVFMRGPIAWDEDPEVNENVVVCSFMPQTSSTIATLRPCSVGHRLHCSDTNFQLYNKQRGDTFIFLTRPPAASGADLAVSIALRKISQTVQRQLGRVNRTPVTAIELHVVSNRDRVAHQLFDLWFEHVPTEEFVKRFDRKATPYRFNTLQDVDWTSQPDWLRAAFIPDLGGPQATRNSAKTTKHTAETMNEYLLSRTASQIDTAMEFSTTYHAEDELFLMFNYIVSQEPFRRDVVIKWINTYPPLVFALLKTYPPDENFSLPATTQALSRQIIQNIIRCANTLRVAVLVALEKLAATIATISLEEYFDHLMLAAMSVRSQQLVQEVLFVLNDGRLHIDVESPALRYGYKHALAVVFDRAEEAANECPCDEDGKPRKQRIAPTRVTLNHVEDHPNQVKAAVRVDAKTAVRLHSHVRLQAASKPENQWIQIPIMDGVVVQSTKGELKIDLLHPPPPEMERMEWNMYHAGSTATTKAMLEAILRLLLEKQQCCQFYSIITGDEGDHELPPGVDDPHAEQEETLTHLNASQIRALNSYSAPLSLIWGPPGTGKTTVVVQILCKLLQTSGEDAKILMTASTHNAVDNVLERFLKENKKLGLVLEEEILRVATDQAKVDKALQHFTVDARVGGDVNENNRLAKKAQERVKAAKLVFTTCAGAGLGTLRKIDFGTVLIDEASQITEPGSLVPLVKGVQHAILVGDHVQLRPTVGNMAKVLEFDVSLLERLYMGADVQGMAKSMLDVQYRSPQKLNEFPSTEFYQGRLETGINNADMLTTLEETFFPWPRQDDEIVPTIFVPCAAEEDMGGRSKSNPGQVEAVGRILGLLALRQNENDNSDTRRTLSITVLSPYTKQIHALRQILPPSVPCSTVDAFQGRESDVVIFSSVRCNAEGDIGFLEDSRRLNVMWTRARLGLIIIGDRGTLGGNPLWKRALATCVEVVI